MADIFTKETRSKIMSKIRGKDTKPEILVSKYLHKAGFRYGLHNKKLPGCPDLVLRKYKTVIFVHGCFWHGHSACRDGHIPKTRTEFWGKKIQRNISRAFKNEAELKSKGWQVIVIWECDLKIKNRIATLDSLVSTLNNQ